MPNRTGQPKTQDQVSVFFADVLEQFAVEENAVGGLMAQTFVCQRCREVVCTIDEGDTIRVLLNTALHHDCPD